MNRYAVMGNPIQHSQSPLIHRMFAEQTGQVLTYDPILVNLDGLAAALDEFQAQGGSGVNITLPFKHRAFNMVDSLSERGLQAQAINTIQFNENGTRFGDNTDGVGLVRDITVNAAYPIKDKRVLILGAGGAVSGVIGPLLDESPAELVIANRTVNKAFAIAENFVSDAPITACDLQELAGQTFDLVINGTSASLQGDALILPADLLRDNALCYDMVYGKGQTPFLSWAKKSGAQFCRDGLGMLVEQAAEAFYLWRNVRPETKTVLAALRPTELLSPL